jgi:hypothetical protein
VKLQYTLNSDDVGEVNRVVTRPKLIRTALWVPIVIVMIGLLAVTTYGNRKHDVRVQKPDVMPRVAGILAITALAFFVAYARRKAWTKKSFREQRGLQGPIDLELEEQGVKISTGLSRIAHSWAIYISYAETKGAFLLFQTSNQAFLVPKRAIVSEADMTAVRSLLQAKIGVLYPAKRIVA